MYSNPTLTAKEVLMFLIYASFFVGILISISARYKNADVRKMFITGGLLKMAGGLMVCLVYIYVYKYGDTFRFFRFGLMYKDLLLHSPEFSFWEALFMTNEQFKDAISYKIDYAYGYAESSFIINKISGILSIFTFDSFFATTLIFSMMSFTGIWKMYQVFVKKFPFLQTDLALMVIFLPSVVFWGSGLLKDTLCIGGLGWLTWGINGLIIENRLLSRSSIKYLLAGVFAFWLVLSIKTYIILAYSSGASLWIFFHYRDKISNKIVRAALTPLLISVVVPLLLLGLQSFSQELGAYALENVVNTAVSLQYNLSKLDAGSTYNLGTINPTIGGVLSKFPAAVNVTLFRPYPWEATSGVVIMFAALESLFVFLLTIYVVLKVGVFATISKIINNGFLIFCFTYAIIFSFAVGISSSNFGSLVRYKIPAIPFYLVGLIATYYLATGRSVFKDIFKRKRAQPMKAPTVQTRTAQI